MLASLTVLHRLAARPAAAQSVPEDLRGSWAWHGDDAQRAMLDLTFPYTDEGEQHRNRVARTSIGITRASLAVTTTAGAAVRFSLVRDAGTFHCTGVLDATTGSGDVIFEKSRSFERSIERSGFEGLADRDLLDFALFDVDASFLTALRPAFPDASARDFVKLRMMQVPASYALGVKRFAPSMRIDDVVALAMFKVQLEDIERLEQLGDGNASAKDIVGLTFAGVDALYVDDLAAAGYGDLTLDNYKRLRFANVDGAYLKRIDAAAKHLTVDQVLRLKFGE